MKKKHSLAGKNSRNNYKDAVNQESSRRLQETIRKQTNRSKFRETNQLPMEVLQFTK